MVEPRRDRRGFLGRLGMWAAALGLENQQARADDPKRKAEEIGPGPVRQELKGRLTLVQDTSHPEPGGSPHGEALAIVTDGRGIPFAFYERDLDGTPHKVPSTFIGNGGDINTGKWVIISNVHPPAGENYYCIPPSNDPCMLGVWQDVENCIQARGRSEHEAFTIIRDESGTYCMSIGNDGTIRWGSGKVVSKWTHEPGHRDVRAFLPDFLRYNPVDRCLETNMEIRKVER